MGSLLVVLLPRPVLDDLLHHRQVMILEHPELKRKPIEYFARHWMQEMFYKKGGLY